jgi:hypothetical protein
MIRKGENGRRQSVSPRVRRHAAYQLGMSEMHSVKVAERNRRRRDIPHLR